MCECSKRHLQRNGGQLAGVGTTAEGPAVNGYIKHVMRHHKGRGGHCPPITSSKSIDRATTAPARDHKSVSLKFFFFKSTIGFLVCVCVCVCHVGTGGIFFFRGQRSSRRTFFRSITSSISNRRCQLVETDERIDDNEPGTGNVRMLKTRKFQQLKMTFSSNGFLSFFSFVLSFCLF